MKAAAIPPLYSRTDVEQIVGSCKRYANSRKIHQARRNQRKPAHQPTTLSDDPPSPLRAHSAPVGRNSVYRFVGESEGALRQTFAEASRRAPCLIVFDEVDTLCPRRDQANSEAQRRVVSTMLALLDGVDGQERVRTCVHAGICVRCGWG